MLSVIEIFRTRTGLAVSAAFVVLALSGCAGGVGSGESITGDPVGAVEAAAAEDGAAQDAATIEVLEPETDPNSPQVTAAEGAVGNAASRYTIVAQATTPSVTARESPDPAAAPVAEFTNPTPTGSPLVFRSINSEVTSSEWIEVQLPIQPNGTTGWVPRSDVSLSDNPYRVEISRAEYALKVYHLNQLWMETPIAVGTGDTPTPVGDFYLLELLSPPDPDGPYGPFAFGLSGFSEVLDSFGGAETAIIGLHGTNDPDSLGTSVSHGCIRLENQVIEQLATVLPLGTPVSIT